jgi:TonB family protein
MGYQNNDIEKYLKGELTAAERHALEQKALHDPFLAEALEGAEHAGAENFSLDIELLKRSVKEKSRRRYPKVISLNGWGLYMGIAAGLLLLAVSSFIVLTMIRQQQSPQLATSKAIAPDTIARTQPSEKNKKDSVSSVIKPDLIAENPERDSAEPSNKPRKAKPNAAGTGERARAEEVTLAEVGESEDQQIVEADLQEAPVISRAEAQQGKRSATQPIPGVISGIGTVEKVVRGKVVSAEDGSELPGVNVLIKGTNKGTVTNATGNFEIALPQGSEALVFSFIGLTSQEVAIANDEVNVKMDSDVTQLSEMVVTGYGADENLNKTHLLEMAEPLGGRKAFKKYLEDQLQYPNQALANEVEGKVTVQFTVLPNGQLSDFKVLKGLGYGCDEEVIRLIKEGPAWAPSRKDNEPVREDVKIRLKFDLPEKK